MTQPDAQPKTAEELGAALAPKHRQLAEAYLETLNVAAAGRAAKYSDRANAHRAFKRPDVQAYIAARFAEACMAPDEVLARLSARARLDGSDFFKQEAYEVAVYEPRPLREKIAALESRVGQLQRIDPGLLKAQIEKTQAEIADLEVKLALDPDATWDKQIGTETRYRTVASLEAARENGVLQFVESAEYGPNGLKFKWADPVKALELIGKHHKLFTEKVEHSGSVDTVIGIDFIMPGGET